MRGRLTAAALLPVLLLGVTPATAAAPRRQSVAATRKDPYVSAGTLTLTVDRHRDVHLRWQAVVRGATTIAFLIYRSYPSGGTEQEAFKEVRLRSGRQVVRVDFFAPRVLRGAPCVSANLIDQTPDTSSRGRVYPLGPFSVNVVCPIDGFPSPAR